MIFKLLHLNGLKCKIIWFLINKIYVGTKAKSFEKKRKLMNRLGHEIGEGTKIVGPVFCSGILITGKDCWIGKNLTINGNGKVYIGDRCDIAPDVIFQTGSHHIGDSKRRAGQGYNENIKIGSGTWIGVRTTVLPDVVIGNSCVVAAGAMVIKSIDDNKLVGGVPAKILKGL